MYRPIVFLTAFLGLTSTTFAFPARAGSEIPGAFVESSATAVEIPGPGGTVAGTTVVHRTVDSSGRVLATSSRTEQNPEVRAQAADFPFVCSHDSYRAGFTTHPRREAYSKDENDLAQAFFFPYEQQNARLIGRTPTQQWLVCAVGGADPNNGSRITKAGPGTAYRDSGTTYKLGQTWKEGSTPANYTVSLGFQTEGPVQVSGGMTQTPQHSLKGSPRPPQADEEMDRIARNGVNGWWEHACEPHCGGNGSPEGTSDFQGSVVEGLWEFPLGRTISPDSFLMKVYWTHHCANFFGRCEG